MSRSSRFSVEKNSENYSWTFIFSLKVIVYDANFAFEKGAIGKVDVQKIGLKTNNCCLKRLQNIDRIDCRC